MDNITQQLINGIAHEVAFWRKFVSSDRFRLNWSSSNVNPELEQKIKDLIPQDVGRVLDVGSGPVSILHGWLKPEQYVAVDPLAEFYKDLVNYDAIKITPPIGIQAEELADAFEKSRFDVVHIRNAFDHTQDPVKAFRSMEGLVAKGGKLIIHGFENEAISENWAGLHQWNIEAKEKGIELSGRRGKIEFYKGNVETRELPTQKTWFTFWK